MTSYHRRGLQASVSVCIHCGDKLSAIQTNHIQTSAGSFQSRQPIPKQWKSTTTLQDVAPQNVQELKQPSDIKSDDVVILCVIHWELLRGDPTCDTVD